MSASPIARKLKQHQTTMTGISILGMPGSPLLRCQRTGRSILTFLPYFRSGKLGRQPQDPKWVSTQGVQRLGWGDVLPQLQSVERHFSREPCPVRLVKRWKDSLPSPVEWSNCCRTESGDSVGAEISQLGNTYGSGSRRKGGRYTGMPASNGRTQRRPMSSPPIGPRCGQPASRILAECVPRFLTVRGAEAGRIAPKSGKLKQRLSARM